MQHFAWANQRFIQGNASFIVLLSPQYLGIARERGNIYIGTAWEGGFIYQTFDLSFDLQ